MNQNRFLYTMKLIACLAVITIHVRFPDPAGQFITALARFAVPFFFAVSGRYLLGNAGTTKEIRLRVLQAVKKLLKITLIVYLIYQAYSVFYHLLMGVDIAKLFIDRYNPGSIKRFLLFNAGTVLYDDSYVFDHMWYLFAAVYVLLFIWCIAPVLRKCYVFMMVFLLFALHLLTWIQDFHIVRIFGISFTTWYVLRSWLFTGIPYVFLGILWADITEKFKKDRTEDEYRRIAALWKVPGICFLSIGILSTCFETCIIGNKDIYIGSFFMVLGLFMMSEVLADKGGKIWKIGKAASSNIYFYHVLILAILNLCIDRGVLPGIPGAVKPVVLMILCIIMFYVLPEYKRSVINVKKG